MQHLQHSAGARRLLRDVIIYASTPSSWSTGDGTIPSVSGPLPSTLSGQSQSSDATSSSFDTVNHFSPSVAIIMVALLSAFFFMGFFSLYIRRCADSPSDMRGSLRRANEFQAQHEQGIDPDFLHSLPLIAYSSAKKKGSNIECVVCLTDFEEHEPLRQLPACKHVFHQDCIDMWLFSHSTCPLCRHHITTSGGSVSLRWGGSGNFRQLSLIGGAGGSGQQIAERESNDTIIGIHRVLSMEMGTTARCRGNPSAETNADNILHRPFAETSVNSGDRHSEAMTAVSSIAAREESFPVSNRASHNIARLTRLNSTGHSLQMGPANEANSLLTCSGESSSPRPSLHRSSSAMVVQYSDQAL